MNTVIATDMFMPMLLKRRSPSVLSWSSKRKLTCDMFFSLFENDVHRIINACHCQADERQCSKSVVLRGTVMATGRKKLPSVEITSNFPVEVS